MEELDIKYKTLQKWENAGLRRYQPPLEDTRKVYYKVSDILNFWGLKMAIYEARGFQNNLVYPFDKIEPFQYIEHF